MVLRKLKPKDAAGMLEWMLDSEIACFFQFDAASMDMEKTLAFIEIAQIFGENRHYAVVDEYDAYLGTVSLKNIDIKNKNAEYAISMCKKAIGTGIASAATFELIRIAFEEIGLDKIYLNVFADNARAIRFYEKLGFVKEGFFRRHVFVRGEYKDLCWYAYFKEKCE